MNDKKQELAKKKALLEEFKKRKIEREKQKLLDDRSFNSHLELKKDVTKCSDQCSSNDVDQLLSSLGLEGLVKSKDQINTNASNIRNSSVSENEHDKEFLFEIAIKKEKTELKQNTILNQVNIYPDEKIMYSKECQTIESVTNMLNETHLKNHQDDDESHKHSESLQSKKNTNLKPLAYYEEIFVYDTFQWEDEFEAEHPKSKSLNEQTVNGIIDNLEKTSFQVNSHNEKFFSDSDNYEDDDGLFSSSYKSRNHLFHREEHDDNDTDDYDSMVKFLLKNRPIVERALKQNETNIFYDYKSEKFNQKKNDSNEDAIRFKKSFSDKRWSSIVTCLDWSYQHPELLLCSYDNMSFYSEQSESEAIVAIWNVKSDQKEPQQLFSSMSLITSCIFSPFHPNIILAGTYSGQIVMWDLRSNKRTPIQRSAISTNCHTNPVYCLKNKSFVETESIISISNDGKMCLWNLENFNMPYETQELLLKDASIRNISATCFDTLDCFSQSLNEKELNETVLNTKIQPEISNQLDQSLIFIGSEDGLVHTLSHKNNKFEHVKSYDEHYGPLTAISSQCQLLSQNTFKLPHLFLTSSFDSTVKLWDMTESDQTSQVFTFESHGEYIYDVGWSPKHPSLFACVDGSGKLDIWNISKDSENSLISINVDNGTKSLNRLKWSRNGTEIAVGDDNGKISIYEINESIALPNQNEFDLLLDSLKTLKQLEKEAKVFNKKEDFSFLVDSF